MQGGKDWSAEIAVLEEKVTALENADTSHTSGKHSHDMKHTHENTQVKINETEIKLLKNSIEELKASNSNPLAKLVYLNANIPIIECYVRGNYLKRSKRFF